MTHYKKHSIYKGRRAIFAFISIILVCMLLQGNVRAAEMLEGEPAGAEATATDAGNVEAPRKRSLHILIKKENRSGICP